MLLITSFTALLCALNQGTTTVYLDELDLGPMTTDWSTPKAMRNSGGSALAVAGRSYMRGVGTHANSVYTIRTGGKADRFKAVVGVDDSANGAGSIEFLIYGDRQLIFRTGTVRKGVAKEIDLAIRSYTNITLSVSDAGDGIGNDVASWCEARLTSSDPTFSPTPVYTKMPDKTKFIYPGPSVYIEPDAPWIVLPVVFVVSSDDDGRNPGLFNKYLIPSSLKALNNSFKYAKIRFACDPEVDYKEMRSTLINRDFDSPSDVYMDEGKRPVESRTDAHFQAREKLAWSFKNRIPIVCRRGSVWIYQKKEQRWVDVPSPTNYAALNGLTTNFGLGTDANNFSHEFGHSLGLPHTFGPLGPSSVGDIARMIREADGKGLTKDKALDIFDGDLPFVKDTTPSLPENPSIFGPRVPWKAFPQVDIPVTFADGENRRYLLQPDPFNIMGYWHEWRNVHPQAHAYLGRFSPDQLRVMRLSATQRIDDLHLTPDHTKPPAGTRLEFSNASTSFDPSRIRQQELHDYFGPPDSTQAMRGFQMLCRLVEGETITFKFSTSIPKGTYRIWWAGSYAADYGKFAFSINDQPLREFDAFLMNWRPTGWRDMGKCVIEGRPTIKFKITGKHPLSSGSNLGTDSVVLQTVEDQESFLAEKGEMRKAIQFRRVP